MNPFVISREFDAPRERVWQAWTEPERLQQWFSPKGFSVIAAKLDLRTGGTYHYGMRMADGREVWGKWLIREVKRPERLVFINTFSDPQGGLTRHPFSPDWPAKMLSTITFAEKVTQGDQVSYHANAKKDDKLFRLEFDADGKTTLAHEVKVTMVFNRAPE